VESRAPHGARVPASSEPIPTCAALCISHLMSVKVGSVTRGSAGGRVNGGGRGLLLLGGASALVSLGCIVGGGRIREATGVSQWQLGGCVVCIQSFDVGVLTLPPPLLLRFEQSELREKLSKMYDASDNACISLFGFRTQFGGGKSTGFGLIYDNVDAMKKFEPKHRVLKVRALDLTAGALIAAPGLARCNQRTGYV